jgi:hypothetical protein
MVHSDFLFQRPFIRWTAKAMILTFILQCIPLEVLAATPPQTAIAGFRTGKNSQEDKVRKALYTQLKSTKDILVMEDENVSSILQEYTSSKVDPKSQAVISTAYERYNEGMTFYRKLDLTNALKEFNASVRGYREGISILRDNHYLLFSHLYLGIILHFLGRVEEGKKFIQEMVMLDAERKTRVLPQRDFPPKIVELHKQITKEVLARPVSVLSVDSSPTAATVMFDGAEVGKTPFIIKDIPSGQHFLSLDLQGHQYYAAPIQINAGAQNFTTVLKEKNSLQIYPVDSQTEDVKSELQTIGQKLNTDILILGQTTLNDSNNMTTQVQLFDTRSSTFSEVFEETVSVKKPKFQALVEKIKESILQTGLTTSTAEADSTAATAIIMKESETKDTAEVNLADFNEKPTEEVNNNKPIYKKWWFWGAIGVVVAGTGTYLLMQDNGATANIVTINNPLVP